MDSQTEPPVSRKSVYLSAQKVSIAAVVAFLFLLFGAIVVFANRYGNGTPLPSPSGQPSGLFQAGEASALQAQQQPQVKGAQVPPKPQNYNVPQPTKAPAPTPKSTKEPDPTTAPTTAPTATPEPTPTSAPSNSDNSGPEIKEIQSSGVEDTKATITWKTNEDAEGKVEYGKTTSYGETKDLTEKKTSQSIDLTGLEANTTYHFRIVGKDGSGNSTTSGDNQFTTKPAP